MSVAKVDAEPRKRRSEHNVIAPVWPTGEINGKSFLSLDVGQGEADSKIQGGMRTPKVSFRMASKLSQTGRGCAGPISDRLGRRKKVRARAPSSSQTIRKSRVSILDRSNSKQIEKNQFSAVEQSPFIPSPEPPKACFSQEQKRATPSHPHLVGA